MSVVHNVLPSVSVVHFSGASGLHQQAFGPIRAPVVPGGGTERAPQPPDRRPAQVPGGDAETDQLHTEIIQSPQVRLFCFIFIIIFVCHFISVYHYAWFKFPLPSSVSH